jgi:polysaccharide biosynthesis protein PslH
MSIESSMHSRHAGRRILLLSPFTPHRRALHGGARVVTQLTVGLARSNRVALMTLTSPDDLPVDEEVRALCEAVVEVRLPYDSWSLSQRALGWVASQSAPLFGVPRWAHAWRSDEFRRRLREVVAQWKPEIVQIESHVMAQYAAVLRDQGAPRVLSALEAASLAVDSRLTRLQLRAWAERSAWRRYERQVLADIETVVVFTERDRAEIARLAGGARVELIPFGTDLPATAQDPRGGTEPVVLFVGNYAHWPNVDAAVWLARAIFPRVIDRVPNARLQLLGDAPPADVRALASDRVEVTGRVDDVEPYRDRAPVVVAPLRIGGGMRVKVVEALAAGKAIVATPLACEGMTVVSGEHLEIADSEDEVAESIVALLRDPDRRVRLGTSARAWAMLNLGAGTRIAAYERLYADLLRGATPR